MTKLEKREKENERFREALVKIRDNTFGCHEFDAGVDVAACCELRKIAKEVLPRTKSEQAAYEKSRVDEEKRRRNRG